MVHGAQAKLATLPIPAHAANHAESGLSADAAARKPIMMREVGHLLGVPHIQDDPLMNPSYQDDLAEPTPAALALAKTRALIASYRFHSPFGRFWEIGAERLRLGDRPDPTHSARWAALPGWATDSVELQA